MLEVRLFGRFELKIDGLKITSSSRKTTALVAYLALEGVTNRSELAHHLWTDSNEEAARRSLRQELWQIQKTELGIELHLEGEHVGLKNVTELDVELFPALLEAGDLTAALALYRGELLEGFKISGASAFEEWLEAKRELFAGLRRDALVKQAILLESVNDLRGALQTHLELLNENPLLETHQRDTMRLLAMLGDPALALTRFEQFKRLLQVELGVEPLAETTQLANRIRASQVLVPSLKPLLPKEILFRLPLVGRDTAWALLEQQKAGLIVLLGVPGVGKTRLIEEFARTTSGVFWLHGSEVATETPFYPVAQALRAALENPDQFAKLDALEQVWKIEVARLIPELGAGINSSAFATPTPDGRARFLEGLTRALLAISDTTGLIVFDDLHWADTSSLELLAHLIAVSQVLPQMPCLIATARELELEGNIAAQTLFKNLKRQNNLQLIVLEKLSQADVQIMVQNMSGSDNANLFSKRLFTATAGHPLYILQTIKHLFEIGILYKDEQGWNTTFDDTTSDYTELPMPSSVFEAVLERVEHLGGEAKRVLEAASLAEDGFGLEMLLSATALSEWEGLEAMERLTNTNLLMPAQNTGGYCFSHALIRRAVEESLSTERKRILHHKFALALERTHGLATQIARHLEHASKPKQAVTWRVQAAREAHKVFAFQDALDQYAKALSNGLEGMARYEAFDARVGLYLITGQLTAVMTEVELVKAFVAESNDPRLEIRFELGMASLSFHTEQFSDSLQRSQITLARTDLLPIERAFALYNAGIAIMNQSYLEANSEQLQVANLLFRDSLELQTDQSSELIVFTHNSRAMCLLELGELELAKTHINLALNLIDRRADRILRVNAWRVAGEIEWVSGNLTAGKELLERALREAREIGHSLYERFILTSFVRRYLEAGEPEMARAYQSQVDQQAPMANSV